MNRTQFTFYESFFAALSRIKDKSIRADAYDVICKYALYEEMPDMETLEDSVSMAFELIRPTLDSARKKASNGTKGGSKSKQTASKRKQSESKPKQSESKRKQSASKNDFASPDGESKKEKEGEKEKEKENECYLSLLTPFLSEHGDSLCEAVRDWMQYKTERKDVYTETGLKSLLSQVSDAARKHGEEPTANHIRLAMSNGWVGMNLNLIEEKKPQKKPGYNMQHHGDALTDTEREAVRRMMEDEE